MQIHTTKRNLANFTTTINDFTASVDILISAVRNFVSVVSYLTTTACNFTTVDRKLNNQ
jgi:hypothetical protein